MVKSITLQNFQAHENSTIELKDGVNVFVGTNDSNKSGVVRALNICLFNAAFDPNYIHYGKTFSKITLKFEDGRILERERTKSKNVITFIEADGTKSKPYNVSKMEEKIEEFTGFGLVALDGSSKKSENLQIIETGSAHDILLGCSYETILKRLSTLLGTTEFEQVKLSLSKDLYNLNVDLKVAEKTYNSALEKYQFISSTSVEKVVASLIEKLTSIEEQYKQYTESISILENAHALVQHMSRSAPNLAKLTERFSEIETVFNELKKKDKSHYDLPIDWCQKGISAIRESNERSHELSNLEREREELENELQNYKCKQCGKLVKCYDC